MADDKNLFYRPDLEPDLHYESSGKVPDISVPIVEEPSSPASKPPQVVQAGQIILASAPFVPDMIIPIIQATVQPVIDSIPDNPIYDPYLPPPDEEPVTPTTPPVVYDDPLDDTEVPEFLPVAPNIDIVVLQHKPLYEITDDLYNVDSFDIKENFINRLKDVFQRYFQEMTVAKNTCGLTSIQDLLRPYDATDKISDFNLSHLSDSIIRSQIIRDQKSRLFKKTHSTDETLYHLRACLAAYQQRRRYYEEEYGGNEDYLDTQSNQILFESRAMYDKKYQSAMYNLFKYLNSSVMIIDDSLNMTIREAQAKAQLFKNGVNIFKTTESDATA